LKLEEMGLHEEKDEGNKRCREKKDGEGKNPFARGRKWEERE
jgi:hypothetical protein